ncbi:MAG: glucose 1-dehydrogenase [Candidatus Schekmanbacteria bacterium]|nr:MAG: glucose 1-dehydrogenase [Candidatus Schekmanbacteria bacterium]
MEKGLKRFIDKNVVVTGGGSGIGRGICKRFASEGANVIVADIDEKGGRETVEIIANEGGIAEYIYVDVSDNDSINELIKKSADKFGKIDVAVANAGISDRSSSALEATPDDWDRVYGVNVKGAFFFSKAAILHMMENDVKGSVVTISSIMGRAIKNMTGAYASSKAAVIAFTKTLAKCASNAGIRVNSVAPGMVATNLYNLVEKELMMEKNSFVKWIIDQSIKNGNILIPREGTPEDIAAAVAFLSSEDASYITAQVLCVDGGMDWSW